jgi:cytochrome c biogenesis protein
LSLQSNVPQGDEIRSPKLGVAGWARWIWAQVTSMRTALMLLLLLAVAAIPGSVFPQRSSDPNGVTSYFQNNPELAKSLDGFQLFDVYTSVWFSSIYVLLFISLVGCVIPRIGHHWDAVRGEPIETPRNLSRFPAHLTKSSKRVDVLDALADNLRARRFRVRTTKTSVSAEKGYLRETGNLLFHISLLGVLVSIGIGGATSFSGQRVLVEGETFVNNLSGYDSFSPGAWFDSKQLVPFSVKLKQFQATFDLRNQTNIGTPLDFEAFVSLREKPNAKSSNHTIRVNYPLDAPGAKIYLTGNGYAPLLTFRDKDGNISFSGAVVYLPQDANYTSLGVIKLPDAKPDQFGVISFFYPTRAELKSGAFTSGYPAPVDPLLSMNVYVGDLGLDNGIPSNVFELSVHGLKQVAGGKSGTKPITLELGKSAELPNGLGTVTWDGLKRFASLDIDYNPMQVWVLVFTVLSFLGLFTSLLTPRRRIFARKTASGFELAAMAKNDDPRLLGLLEEISGELKVRKK